MVITSSYDSRNDELRFNGHETLRYLAPPKLDFSFDKKSTGVFDALMQLSANDPGIPEDLKKTIWKLMEADESQQFPV